MKERIAMEGLNSAMWNHEPLAVLAQHLRGVGTLQLNDGSTKTPLMYACSRGRIDAVRLLLDAKADVAVQHLGYDALCYALVGVCYDIDHELMQFLFARGATCARLHHWVDTTTMQSQNFVRAYAQLTARISSCRRRAATVLSACFRAHAKLPRDMAMLLAREIWANRFKA